jgi:hypothetical protein
MARRVGGDRDHMKRDALIIYEQLFMPSEGCFGSCLYKSDWRLDLCYDVRAHPTPFWAFIRFDKHNVAENTRLARSEIYGFLKAKFPEQDLRTEIHDYVKRRTMELFE